MNFIKRKLIGLTKKTCNHKNKLECQHTGLYVLDITILVHFLIFHSPYDCLSDSFFSEDENRYIKTYEKIILHDTTMSDKVTDYIKTFYPLMTHDGFCKHMKIIPATLDNDIFNIYYSDILNSSFKLITEPATSIVCKDCEQIIHDCLVYKEFFTFEEFFPEFKKIININNNAYIKSIDKQEMKMKEENEYNQQLACDIYNKNKQF